MPKRLALFLFHKTSTKQTVAKNTFWLSVSQIGGRLIRTAIIVYAARVLGTAQYGLFSYAITLVGFMGMFVDPGVNSVLIREIAKAAEPERRRVFSGALILKLALVTTGLAFIVFIGPYFSTLPGVKPLLPLAGLILTFDTLRDFFVSLARAAEQMEWDAAISVLGNVAIVVFGFAYLRADGTAESLAVGYAAGTGIGAIAAIILFRDYLASAFRQLAWKLVLPILQSAWPLAVTGALGILSTNIDVLIISWMRTASEVGVYSAAVRIIQVVYLLPVIVRITTLPLFARLAGRDASDFRRALEQTISVILFAAIPIAIGGVILGTQIMTLIFGRAFTSGAASFEILLATAVGGFPGSIMANAIFVYGRQRELIVTSVIAGVSNVLFDLLLIPRMGITGSAVATLISMTFATGYAWHVMRKIVHFEVLRHLAKIATAGLALGVTTLLLSYLHVHVLIDIPAGAAVYLLLLWFLQEPILQDVRAMAFPPTVPTQTEAA